MGRLCPTSGSLIPRLDPPLDPAPQLISLQPQGLLQGPPTTQSGCLKGPSQKHDTRIMPRTPQLQRTKVQLIHLRYHRGPEVSPVIMGQEFCMSHP